MVAMLSETSDTWQVDLRGREVLLINIDYRVTLMLHGESTYDGSVILETPFELRFAGEIPLALDPANRAELGPILRCFKKSLETMTVSRPDGSLSLTFADGTTISVKSHERYEAWAVSGDGFQIIAAPGGGEPMLFRTAPAESASE